MTQSGRSLKARHRPPSKRIGAIFVILRVVFLVCGLASLVSCSEPNKSEGREASEINMVDESPLHTLTRASSPSEALRRLPVSIGDKVRIVSSPITDEQQISGMIGVVTQGTLPPDTRIPDAGVTIPARGVIVHIDEIDRDVGLSTNLLELADLPVGAVISMGDRDWVLNHDGEWLETENDR